MNDTEHPALSDLEIVRAALEREYDVLEELGRGGMATVYRARDRHLDRDVALKVLPFTLAFDRDLVTRFEREARTAAQLEHPHIVPIHRVGRSGQVIYFAMQYLRGETLSARLRGRGRLTAAEVRRVLSETASALGHAHLRGVVHRDVKPDNIMLDADGRCTVTDFGIARLATESRLTATGMSLGTPRYMSPEQARAREVDGRSDLYSLGVVAYECLVGQPPFDSGDAYAILLDHVQAPVPRPALATTGSAEERALYAVIERLLAKLPENRYQTARELAIALESPAPAPARMSAAEASAPTVPNAAALTLVNEEIESPVGEIPRSSAALDAALAAGVDMLRQHKPKVEAGLAAGRRFLRRKAPIVRSVAAQAATQASEAGGRAAAALVEAGVAGTRVASEVAVRAAPRLSRALAYARLNARRGALLLGGGVALALAAYYPLHFAIKHRTRCPAPAAAEQTAAAGAGAESTRSRGFIVLVDAVDSRRAGSNLDVYYDVCGMPAGAYRARVAVTKQTSGLQRLLGGVSPVIATYDETASTPAIRRHRTLDFADMPAGAYTLSVAVTDGRGHRREAETEFEVRER